MRTWSWRSCSSSTKQVFVCLKWHPQLCKPSARAKTSPSLSTPRALKSFPALDTSHSHWIQTAVALAAAEQDFSFSSNGGQVFHHHPGHIVLFVSIVPCLQSNRTRITPSFRIHNPFSWTRNVGSLYFSYSICSAYTSKSAKASKCTVHSYSLVLQT